MRDTGMVYLVGCGPGDIELMTIKALRLIREADVIIYDRLVNERVLQDASPKAEIIYVGKEASHHTLPQEGINQVMVEKARQGKIVARLKGGDPFVFGRGGEEALFLRENGVAFEVVPGVTSAIAAPAYAGIPVTHRDYTSTLAIITGHEKPDKEHEAIAWDKLATGAGTLVFLMGVENLPHIVNKLVSHGRSPKTPVALVRWGTLPVQEVLIGTLDTIVKQVAEARFSPPAVIVVGEVVRLREGLRWFDNRPLFGKRIVVTRARSQASQMVVELEGLGAEVIEFPTISIKSLFHPGVEQVIGNMTGYKWIIFTSVNGVKEFLNQIYRLGYDIRDLKGPQICAIGPATAAELRGRGIRVAAIPKVFRAEAIIEVLQGKALPGEKVLIPRARGAREVLPETLRAQGIIVDEIEIYEAVPEQGITEREKRLLEEGLLDVITFTSSSTVRNFVNILGPENTRRLQEKSKGHDSLAEARPLIACIGPITAETARQLGFDVHLIAREYTIKGLVEALVEWFE